MSETPHPTKSLVTAALIYANGPVHIGHLAGCYLPADIYVRYLRSRYGKDSVLFVSGTDEHGVAITLKARKEGKTPQAILDEYYQPIKDTFAGMGIEFDVFSQTHGQAGPAPTTGGPVIEDQLPFLRHALHTETSQAFFQAFVDGLAADKQQYQFVKKTSQQFFDPEAQQFLADRYIQGTCPVCSFERAYGDQCENCGSTLSPSELQAPRSTLSGATPILKETTHWYLPLDAFEGWLNAYIDSHEGDWKRNVVGQCRSWLKAGLQPRAMTRDLDWGVPVPEGIEGSKGKVLYVWFDAPLGYISATKEWAIQRGQPEAWKDWWLHTAPSSGGQTPEEAGQDQALVHFIGKDNIVFHGLIFPAMLHAHPGEGGRPYRVPTTVAANEFMNLEGEKISTSRNWAVWVHEYLEDFKHYPLHADMLRYYLTAIAPEQKDSDFSWKDFQKRVNDDLVGVIGNFVNRVVSLINTNFLGKLSFDFEGYDPNLNGHRKILEGAMMVLSAAKHELGYAIEFLDNQRPKDALKQTLSMLSLGDELLSLTEPWKFRDDPDYCRKVLVSCYKIACSAIPILSPMLPDTAKEMERKLAFERPFPTPNFLGDFELYDWQPKEVVTLPEPQHLFKRIEDADIEKQLAKLAAAKAALSAPHPAPETNAPPVAAPPAPKAEIAFPDFEKLDLRVATVVAAEKVKKADKLLQLTLDLGTETRTVVSGIAAHYAPEALVGQQVVLLANLAPRTLRGIESHGMVLMGEAPDGTLQLIRPAEGLPNGSVVR